MSLCILVGVSLLYINLYMCERLFSKLTFRSTLTNEHTKQLIQLAVSKSAVDDTSLVDEKRFLSILNWDTSRAYNCMVSQRALTMFVGVVALRY